MRLLTLAALSLLSISAHAQNPMKYPQTRAGQDADEFFGKKVTDPYRWMENSEDPELRPWIDAQNKVTQSYIAGYPQRAAMEKRLGELWNYEKFSAPFFEGEWLYYFRNTGLQNQSVLYRRKSEGMTAPMDALLKTDDQGEIFLDPNTFSKDGTVSLSGLEFSTDGSLLAYQTSDGGSDWASVQVIDSKGERLEDRLINVKFSGTAWRGNDGFYYSTYDKPKDGAQLTALTEHHKLMYHKLGTPQEKDQLIFGGDEMPRRYISASVSEDGRWLIISAANATYGNELYVQDLSAFGDKALITPLATGFDNEHSIILAEGETFYIVTNTSAPNRKLVSIDAANPVPLAEAKVIIPETEFPLEVSTCGGVLYAQYLKDATSQVMIYSLSGQHQGEVKLPGLGTASGFAGRRKQQTAFYSFSSYTTPASIYAIPVGKPESAVWKQPKLAFNPDEYESKQVFYKSTDGTQIPMIISYRKGIKQDGSNPAMLYGYGGFSVSLTPAFSPSVFSFLEAGGVYAVANLRGGGEYGDKWHDAGTKMQKQNVFDDFAAAARYLVDDKWTTKKMLGISGGSNGGLLVGATITQHPDICQVAFPAVGVMDMLRYHKFTAGAGWAYDYGTADDDEKMFAYLFGYSPVHNAKKGTCYPATLVTTGDHDDRVVPAHSFKFAAALQAAQSCANPVLIRIETRAGHGAGKPTAMIIAEAADKWAFFFKNTGAKYAPGK